MNTIIATIPNIRYSSSNQFLLIAGPCVIEDENLCMDIAEHIIKLTDKYAIPYIFKASYKKANRTKSSSFTGLGDDHGLRILQRMRDIYQIPVLTDIHSAEEAVKASLYVDVLQIPAFLCRQTDILQAAATTGKHINVKKGQFLSGESMVHATQKILDGGNQNIMLTDRGNMYGYNDLIVDFRNIPDMKKMGYPVIMDVTHSLQQPNQIGGVSGGRPDMIETIAKAAIAVGADGLFIETHPNPDQALSDGSNMLRLDLLEELLQKLVHLRDAVNHL